MTKPMTPERAAEIDKMPLHEAAKLSKAELRRYLKVPIPTERMAEIFKEMREREN